MHDTGTKNSEPSVLTALGRGRNPSEQQKFLSLALPELNLGVTVWSIIVAENLESSNHRHTGSIDWNYDHAVPAMGPLRVPLGSPMAAHDDGNLDGQACKTTSTR